MRRQPPLLAEILALMMVAAAGCSPQQPFYFSPPRGGDHYVGVAQQIEYPDLDTVTSLDEVNGAKPPLTLDNPKPESYWDLGLEEAIRMALANSTVLRNLGGVQFGPMGASGTPSSLLQAPGSAATIYIPGITEADPRYGVEAALSAFDAQLSSSLFWENNIIPQNSAGVGADLRPADYKQQVGSFTADVGKTTASGAQFDIRHDVKYNLDNTPTALQNPLGSKRWVNDWTVDLQAEGRIPLLQGAGTGFNRIAGPGAIAGQPNGVMLARLRTDQSLTDFEAAVRNLCNDTERSYWNLYYVYRLLDTSTAWRDEALLTWRKIHAKVKTGGAASALELAQAHDDYLLAEHAVEQAQSGLYRTENVLRYMLGLTHSDGRLIRPSDEPTRARVEFDWYDIHAEALTRSVEIRKQKWSIKQRELELVAAKNYLLPRLDMVGRYGWAGIGDMLIDPARDLQNQDPTDPTSPLVPHSGYGSLTSGQYPSWHLGFEFRMPFGFRREMAGVRYAQLSLTRERKILQEQELELSNQLADAVRDLSEQYNLLLKNYNRAIVGKHESEAARIAYDNPSDRYRIGLDQVLNARRRQTEAETAFYRSLVDHTLAITQIHFRKGSLLEYDGVFLAEGPWPAKAYFDAQRRARHRDASHFINYGFTQPRIVSQGLYQQGIGEKFPEGDMPIDAPLPVDRLGPTTNPSAGPEEIQTPVPIPMTQNPSTGAVQRPQAGVSPSARQPRGMMPVRRIAPTAKAGENSTPAAKGHDLAAMNLQKLAEPAPAVRLQAPIRTAPQVDAATYQQPSRSAEAAGATEPSAAWKSASRSDKANESVETPSPAPTAPAPSGWKSVQHRSARAEL